MWGLKTIELRSWRTLFQGRVFIHASKTIDEPAMRRFGVQDLPLGAIIGSVCLSTIEPLTRARWAELAEGHLDPGQHQPGCFAWHLSKPRVLEHPVPCRGGLGLFIVDIACDPGLLDDA